MKRISLLLLTVLTAGTFLPMNAAQAIGTLYNGTSGDVACSGGGFFSIENNVFLMNPEARSDEVDCIGEIVIPSGVTRIEDGATIRTSNRITRVVIPNTVTYIGVTAFPWPHFTTVRIPDGVTFLGNDAFNYGSFTTFDYCGTRLTSDDLFHASGRSDYSLICTAPAVSTTATAETAAKAAAAVAAAKREAEVKTARADISKTLAKADKLTADSFAKADIAGVTSENIAQVQAEILALPAELRTDINQVLKVARKYEVVGKIASEQATTLPISAFVEVGLIPAESKNKAALIAAVRRASADTRDSFADIQAVIAAEAARIQDRKDRLAATLARLKSK